MIDGRKVLAVITARGGSKGLPGKNVAMVGGRPMVTWSVAAAQGAVTVDRTILSSDDAEIIAVARQAGCDVPFVRPAELASDTATAVQAVLHALDTLPERYDYVVMLQATSPRRLAEDIDGAVRLCHESGAPSVVTVCPVDKSPYWMYRLAPDKSMTPILPKLAVSGRRQEQPVIHVLNGAVFVARVERLREVGDFLEDATVAYEMPKERSLDVDDAVDLALVDLLMSRT